MNRIENYFVFISLLIIYFLFVGQAPFQIYFMKNAINMIEWGISENVTPNARDQY